MTWNIATTNRHGESARDTSLLWGLSRRRISPLCTACTNFRNSTNTVQRMANRGSEQRQFSLASNCRNMSSVSRTSSASRFRYESGSAIACRLDEAGRVLIPDIRRRPGAFETMIKTISTVPTVATQYPIHQLTRTGAPSHAGRVSLRRVNTSGRWLIVARVQERPSRHDGTSTRCSTA